MRPAHRTAVQGQGDGYPTSLQQENRLLREAQVGKGVILGFDQFLTRCVALPGAVDVNAVQRAVQILVDRHEVIRTAFRQVGDEFRQFVVCSPRVRVAVRETPTHHDAVAALREAYAQPFAPDTELFLRTMLLRHGADKATLVIIIDHLVGDDTALQNLIAEFLEAYCALRAGENVAAQPESRLQFKDWALAQRRTVAEKEAELVEFWRETLGPAGPFPPSMLFDPMDGWERARLARVTRSWAEPTRGLVQQLATRHRMSRFMVLLGVAQTALLVAAEQDEIVVHSAISNRTTEEAMAMVGSCAHGLPFKVVAPPDATVEGFLLESRRVAMEVYRHSELPLTGIVSALAPADHSSVRSLRPSRFYFGYYEERGRDDEYFHLDETEVTGAAQWAPAGLSVDLTVVDDQIEVHLHFGEGRMDPGLVGGIGDLMRTVVTLLANAPDTSLRELRDYWSGSLLS